jgi:AcrR family transcriptional regulator
MPDVANESRRMRLRRELTADIVRIAREQIAVAGPGGVTWRAIGRELGMNPASLYTYFDSRDDLFTALILESSTRLGHAVQAASDAVGDADPQTQVLACLHAFRDWSIANPGEFNLIFIDLIPGYAAPDDAGTLDAELAVIRPISQAVGKLTGRDGEPSQYVPEAADSFIALWAMTHGLISLEVNNHAPPSDARARFDRIVTAAVHRLAQT